MIEGEKENTEMQLEKSTPESAMSEGLTVTVPQRKPGKKKTKAAEAFVPPEPTDGQCAFYVLRKRRFCRFRPHKGQKFCAEHALVCGATLERTRVQCPCNPKHTCYKDMLEKHLRKCIIMTTNTSIYYEEGINSGYLEDSDTEQHKVSVRTASKEDLHQLIDKVERLHEDLIGIINLEELDHASLVEELCAPYYGFKVMRQRKQQASLIGHLERLNLLRDGLCYIELGAGRGQFAHWVQKAMKTCDNSSFILVDKDTCRYKFDSFHKGVNQGPSFERLRVNLADINLGKVESIQAGGRPVVGMGKHLCGGATDLALRCLMETLSPVKKPGSADGHTENLPKPESADKLEKEQNGHREMTEDNLSDEGESESERSSVNVEERAELDLTPKRKEEMGRKCKQLLDLGRVKYLQEKGLSACLKAYIDSSYTPENIVLLATPP